MIFRKVYSMKKIVVILVMAFALVPGAVFCGQAKALKQTENLNSFKLIALSKFFKKNSANTFINSLGMEFNYIEPGTFQMGSGQGNADEMPVHEVTITKGFFMMTTEVIKWQWYLVMKNSPWAGEYNVMDSHNSPAEYVSWEDVQIFIDNVNKRSNRKYRLPTEAEWEYACRAGSTTEYSFDDIKNINNYVWYMQNTILSGEGYTHLVGQKEPNAWGLLDMHGNAWEWCQDWYSEYRSGSVIDPKGPAWGSYRVLRGGNWKDHAYNSRSAMRSKSLSDNKRIGYGFRLVSDTDSSKQIDG